MGSHAGPIAAAVNPVTLFSTALAGGASVYQSIMNQKKAKQQQDDMSKSQTPPPLQPPISAFSDPNAADATQQRQRKLAALKFGFASTINTKPSLAPASLATPMATPLKTKLGQ